MIKQLFDNDDFGISIDVLNNGTVEVWAKEAGVDDLVFMQFTFAQFVAVADAWQAALDDLKKLMAESESEGDDG